jgi:hypothetical protein
VAPSLFLSPPASPRGDIAHLGSPMGPALTTTLWTLVSHLHSEVERLCCLHLPRYPVLGNLPCSQRGRALLLSSRAVERHQ